MSGVQEGLYLIARDLTSLEVNTVIKERMTALKMPPVPTALRDVIDGYEREMYTLLIPALVVDQLGELQCSSITRRKTGPGGLDFDRDADLPVPDLIRDFQALHQLARRVIGPDGCAYREWLLPDRQGEVDPLEAARRLRRVHRSCSQILDLLIRTDATGTRTPRAALAGALEPDYREMIELRKIWDIGTEEVIAQTVIQLDGDVLMRISPKFQHDVCLLRMHQESTQTALNMWQGLIEAVVSFFGKLAGKAQSR